MSVREAERRAAQYQQSDPDRDRKIALNQFRVLTFAQWCALNGISPATGRRLIKAGRGPALIQLSDRKSVSPSVPTPNGRLRARDRLKTASKTERAPRRKPKRSRIHRATCVLVIHVVPDRKGRVKRGDRKGATSWKKLRSMRARAIRDRRRPTAFAGG